MCASVCNVLSALSMCVCVPVVISGESDPDM